jgi:hypothetical protein
MKSARFSFPFFGLLILASFLFSCQKQIALTHLKPAEINVSPEVQRLLLVDRTEPESQALSVITGLLTGEVPFEVRNAVGATLSSLQNELNTSPRYEVIRATERLKGGLFSQTYPRALSWEEVESLAARYNADAVLALELFNSDWIVTDRAKQITVKEGTGKDARDVVVSGVYVEGVANVSVGYRLYDPITRTITDQHRYSKTNTWSAEARNKTQAMANLITKVAATEYVGRMAGLSYAHRIAPMYVNINRGLYSQSKYGNSLQQGAREAEVGQWEKAIGTWQKGLATADDKAASRLLYNLAVAHEVLGQLDLAQQFAGEAYSRYGFKAGRRYARELNELIQADQLAKAQLNR